MTQKRKSGENWEGQMNIHSIVPEVVTDSVLAGCCTAIIMLYSRAVAEYRIANAWRILWYTDPDIVVFY